MPAMPWKLEDEIPSIFAALHAVRAHCNISFSVVNGEAVEVDVPSLRMRTRDQIESWKRGMIPARAPQPP